MLPKCAFCEQECQEGLTAFHPVTHEALAVVCLKCGVDANKMREFHVELENKINSNERKLPDGIEKNTRYH